MFETRLRQALQESVEDVLETMFFVRTFDDCAENLTDRQIIAYVNFEGQPSGSLTLRIGTIASRSIAADFLGEEKIVLGERQIGEVVCELANMICGSLLSRLERNTTFRLRTPSLLGLAEPEATSAEVVAISNGPMLVTVKMEKPECPPIAESAS